MEISDLEEILAHCSKRDMQDWFESPFWMALKLLLDEQVEISVQDIVNGDISEQNKEADKAYAARNSDELRGGVKAFKYVLNSVQSILEQELEAAWANRIKE